MRVIGLLLTAVAFASALNANEAAIKRLDGSTISSAQVDETVTHLMKAAEVTGVGIAIFTPDTVQYLKGYGFRDKEENLPLTPDSVMSGASFTKAAFAYMVMKLVDQGVIDLDRPIGQYLPKPLVEYPQYKDLAGDARANRITTRMLLSHTAGFANFRAFEDDRKLRIHFEPGSRFAYSGEGMLLLQLVVETVTKEPLEELMERLVFQPLGMTRTSMIWQDRFDSDFANGYDEYGRSLGPNKRSRADAAGSMQTTVRDFAHFAQAIMAGKGLSGRTRNQMLRPQIRILSRHEFPTLSGDTTEQNQGIKLSYGLGWGLYWTPYGEAFFKEGHDDGWRNYAVCFDQAKVGIVIMTNSGNGEGIYKGLLEGLLADTFTPIEWEGFTPYDQLPPRPALKQHKVVQVDAALLDKYAGRYGEPPNLILTIRREGDHLSIQENDEPRQELLAEGEKDFYSTASDDSLTFVVGSGRVTGMILHADGKNIPMKRIE